jgi:hypothetical protein
VSWESFQPFVSWLGNTGLGLWLGKSPERIAWLFIFHIIGLTLLLGTLLISNLRIFGLALKKEPVSQVARDIEPLSLIGLVFTLVSGFLIFTGGAENYFSGEWFRTKMSFLLIALIFHFAVFRPVIRREKLNLTFARLAGGLTLVLWFVVGIAGRAIAFF